MQIEIDLEIRCLCCDEVFRISPRKPIRAVCEQCGADVKSAMARLLGVREETTEPANPGDYLSVDDACKMLGGISRTTLWRYRQMKNGLDTYEVGGRPVFKREDVCRLARKRDDSSV